MFIPVKITSQEIEYLISDGTVNANYGNHYARLAQFVRTTLTSDRLINDSFINGTKLQEDWFPQGVGPFDVFISHSSNNVKLVKRFAKWLEIHLGLSCFIDSVYWGYSVKLLKKLDDELCKYRDRRTLKPYYYYNRRNFTTSNVHCMLTMALMKMIDQCELLVFVDSDESLRYNKGQEGTPSPWIYEELEMANLLPHKIPERFIDAVGLTRVINEGRQQRLFSENEIRTHFFYEVGVDNFEVIDAQMLREVRTRLGDRRNHVASLNSLYREIASR